MRIGKIWSKNFGGKIDAKKCGPKKIIWGKKMLRERIWRGKIRRRLEQIVDGCEMVGSDLTLSWFKITHDDLTSARLRDKFGGGAIWLQN